MSRSFSVRRVGVLLAAVLVVAGGALWYSGLLPARPGVPQNSIQVIAPYMHNGTWVFDDARVGLVREPFVGGVPEMIDVVVADIPDAADGFRLTFSAKPFPEYEKKLTWSRGDREGNYYTMDDPPMEGWLCPALFKYYNEAPAELYVKADPLTRDSS